MIILDGTPILEKYAIVKGKEKYKILCRYTNMSGSVLQWTRQEDILQEATHILLFDSKEKAREYISKELPDMRKLDNATPKAFTIKIGDFSD